MNIFAHKGVVHDTAGEATIHILSDALLISVVAVVAVSLLYAYSVWSKRHTVAKESIKSKERELND